MTLAFDIYGTLIDTQGMTSALEKQLGKRAPEFSRLWRDKQLEYTFRRGLMKKYEDFDLCTRQALRYASAYFKIAFSSNDSDALMAQYKMLPAFEDVATGLAQVKAAGFKLYAFSNGREKTVTVLLEQAGIKDYFVDVVSVDEIASYKPDPRVYRHFLGRAGVSAAQSWLVSSNAFDVIGAKAVGMKTVWLKRTRDVLFDPWGIEPDITINSLLDLTASLP
ncbi:MAG: haloacid dehalogenase type II [Gallionella sp.]